MAPQPRGPSRLPFPVWLRLQYATLLAQIVYNARVSQVAVEVLNQETSDALVSQVAIEVLQSVGVHENRDENSGRPQRPGPRLLLPLPLRFQRQQFIAGSTPPFVARPVNVTFAGTSSLSATFRELNRITLTLAGTSSLTATVTKITPPVAANPLRAEPRRPGPPHLLPLPLNLNLNRTLSSGVAAATTDFITVVFAGQGHISTEPNEADVGPLTLAGTSSLTTSILPRIVLVLAGSSSLSFNFHRKQFVLQIHGFGTLTVGPYTIGPKGGGLSQLALEVARTSAPDVSLSQVTLEVARARDGMHIWQKM